MSPNQQGVDLPFPDCSGRTNRVTKIASAQWLINLAGNRPPKLLLGGRRKRDLDYTASFNSLDGRKATFLLALILITSPVAGFRPMRAPRFFTCKIPRPEIRIFSPFFRCLVISPTRSVR